VLRRRLILLSALVAIALGLGWSLWQQSVTLRLQHPHPVVVRAFPDRIARSVTGPGLLAACGWLDDSNRAAATRSALSKLAAPGEDGPVDLGFGPGDASPEIPGTASPGSVTLPLQASTLLSSANQPLLLLHAFEPRVFAETSRRRGWLGPLAAEVAASANAVTVLATESASPPLLQITLALEFADGTSAESALKRLTDAQGDFGQLGFAAQPGYERIVRRTKLVVIRMDVDAALARSKVRTR
jgi:hypothetical protein